MTTIRDLYAAVDRAAPFASCESFDNVGLLVGDPDREVSRVLLTLDVTQEAVSEAEEKGCTLILSHHPVIFHPLKSISFGSVQGRLLAKEISVLSAHTNVDKALLNAALAQKLGIRNFQPLEEDLCAGEGILPFEEPVPLEKVIARVAEALSLKGLRAYDAGKPVGKVMLCCGGGGSMIHDAIRRGADLLIAGDFKHDQVIDASNAGVSCIDAGHFETERHFLPLMEKLLAPQFPDVTFMQAESCQPSFQFYTF